MGASQSKVHYIHVRIRHRRDRRRGGSRHPQNKRKSPSCKQKKEIEKQKNSARIACPARRSFWDASTRKAIFFSENAAQTGLPPNTTPRAKTKAKNTTTHHQHTTTVATVTNSNNSNSSNGNATTNTNTITKNNSDIKTSSPFFLPSAAWQPRRACVSGTVAPLPPDRSSP